MLDRGGGEGALGRGKGGRVLSRTGVGSRGRASVGRGGIDSRGGKGSSRFSSLELLRSSMISLFGLIASRMHACTSKCCVTPFSLLPFSNSYTASSLATAEAFPVTNAGVKESMIKRCPFLIDILLSRFNINKETRIHIDYSDIVALCEH